MKDIIDADPLLAYSRGLLSTCDAVERLGLRHNGDLLVALGDAGLSMPMPPDDEIAEERRTFVKLWNTG